jgi:FKBP-type peptidyl-prolyl cis-trans isomerase SlyD
MIYVEDNLKVSISYKVRDLNNKILEEIPEHHPFAYIHGCNTIIPGLEKALSGKRVGDYFNVSIPFAEGYGPYRNELIIEVPKSELKDVGELWIGMELELYREQELDDFKIPEYPEEIYEENSSHELEIYIIKEIHEDSVILDGNHPFAGKDLTFEVLVQNIEEASFTELESGMPDEFNEEDFGGSDDFEKNSQRRWF